MSDLTIEALHEMAAKLRPMPRTPLEEALDQKPILILDADVEGVVAIRLAPGKAAILTRNAVELAGKLRQEGCSVATGKHAREIAGAIAAAAVMMAYTAYHPGYALGLLREIERARAELDGLRSIVGTEQVERALWWAGPNVIRLEAARGYLAEGRTIDENGEWWPQRRHQPGVIRELAKAYLSKQFAQLDDRWRGR